MEADFLLPQGILFPLGISNLWDSKFILGDELTRFSDVGLISSAGTTIMIVRVNLLK